MDILVVNPNTTVSMTEKIRRAAERAAAPGTRIVAVNPPVGPESIEGFYDDALADPGAEAIVLGCAGMADLAAELTARHGLPVVDGVAAAVALAETLVRLGLRTSKLGGYAPPLPKRRA